MFFYFIFIIWNLFYLILFFFERFFIFYKIKKLFFYSGLISSTCLYFFSLFIWKNKYNVLINTTSEDIYFNFFSSKYFSTPFLFFFNQFNIFLDSLSFIFILLTNFIIPVAFLSQLFFYNYYQKSKLFIFNIFFVQWLLNCCFLVSDIFLFFIFFEIIIIPVFLLIGVFGARLRKIKANNYFFLYTLITSFSIFLGIILIFSNINSTNYFDTVVTTFSYYDQIFLWFLFFITFANKIPIFPFHVWLPEAHVEAPTSVSIILASLLLKLGGYGFIRFLIPLFPLGTYFFWPFLVFLSVVSITYCSFSAVNQIDIKKIVAYSSVVHMNLAVLGLFTLNIYGFIGSIFLMLTHGLTSGGLFFCIGVLYDRYHTRIINYYSGLAQIMPVFASIFFIFSISNIGFPGTANFIAEFLLILSLAFKNYLILFSIFPSFLLSLLYSIWVFNKLFFGNLNPILGRTLDLTNREFYCLFILVILIILLGLFPQVVLNFVL